MCTSTTCKTQLWEIKEKKTKIVLLISALTMLLEITIGYLSNSMALLSDGWHMGSHVLAFGAGWLSYKFVLKTQKSTRSTLKAEKIFSLTGYTNGLLLMLIALFMCIESVQKMSNPEIINYKEAIVVSIIGLVVNLISVKVLHVKEHESDRNLKATHIHVLSDILTSVLAIFALVMGLYFQNAQLDPLMGIIGSLVIFIWAWNLVKGAWQDLVKTSAIENLKLSPLSTKRSKN